VLPDVTTVLEVGAGDPTVITTDVVELSVVRVLGTTQGPGTALTGAPVQGEQAVLLAFCSA
jgi:hypothetical protein